MAATTSAPRVAAFACLWICVLCTDTKNVTVKAGEDVTLYCQAPKGDAIVVIQWSIPDLKSHKFVLLYHSNKIHKYYQLPSYQDRVQLRDPKLKDGDASVVLKNVSISDAATYECLVSMDITGRRRRNEPQLTSTINLQVTDSGHTSGHEGDGRSKHDHSGLIAIPVLGVMVTMVSGLFVSSQCKTSMRKNSKQPAAVEAGNEGMLQDSGPEKEII